MSNIFKQIRQTLFGIAIEEASFNKRGFPIENGSETQDFLERHAQTFIEGYNLSLKADTLDELALALEDIEISRRGFGYEGAAMGLSLLDYFSPQRNRLRTFMETSGKSHLYMLHVGAGWTLGRIPRSPHRFLASLDPVLKWLVIDGYGFHEGFFHWSRTFTPPFKRPGHLQGYMRRAFDHGLGRCLWFVKGAHIHQIRETITLFPVDRQPDLWSGVGLASTYAGGIPFDKVHELFTASNQYQEHFAQGVSFAIVARSRAQNPTLHAGDVCKAIWGISSEKMSQVVEECLRSIPPDDQAYEVWRKNIRLQFHSLNESRSDQQLRSI